MAYTVYDIAEKFAHFNLLEYLKLIGAKRGKEMKLKTSFAIDIPLLFTGFRSACPSFKMEKELEAFLNLV